MQSMCPAAPAASPARRRAAPPPPCAGAPASPRPGPPAWTAPAGRVETGQARAVPPSPASSSPLPERKVLCPVLIQQDLRLRSQEQKCLQPLLQGTRPIRQLPKHPLPQGQEAAEPRVSRFLRLRRLPFQEGQRGGGAKQQVTGCRAGGTEADLPKGAVLLNEPGVGPAGQGRGLCSQYPVDLAQILSVQKGAPAAPEGEAEIPLLVRLERLPQPLPQGARVS